MLFIKLLLRSFTLPPAGLFAFPTYPLPFYAIITVHATLRTVLPAAAPPAPPRAQPATRLHRCLPYFLRIRHHLVPFVTPLVLLWSFLLPDVYFLPLPFLFPFSPTVLCPTHCFCRHAIPFRLQFPAAFYVYCTGTLHWICVLFCFPLCQPPCTLPDFLYRILTTTLRYSGSVYYYHARHTHTRFRSGFVAFLDSTHTLPLLATATCTAHICGWTVSFLPHLLLHTGRQEQFCDRLVITSTVHMLPPCHVFLQPPPLPAYTLLKLRFGTIYLQHVPPPPQCHHTAPPSPQTISFYYLTYHSFYSAPDYKTGLSHHSPPTTYPISLPPATCVPRLLPPTRTFCITLFCLYHSILLFLPRVFPTTTTTTGIVISILLPTTFPIV